jgi:hypothetical protein
MHEYDFIANAAMVIAEKNSPAIRGRAVQAERQTVDRQ